EYRRQSPGYPPERPKLTVAAVRVLRIPWVTGGPFSGFSFSVTKLKINRTAPAQMMFRAPASVTNPRQGLALFAEGRTVRHPTTAVIFAARAQRSIPLQPVRPDNSNPATVRP